MLDIVVGSRNVPFLDPIKLAYIRVNSLIVYHMAKTFHALSIQLAFLLFEIQLVTM